ncbi:MAG: hypothetical protein ABUL71_03215 [Gemmatimonadota bacterium]
MLFRLAIGTLAALAVHSAPLAGQSTGAVLPTASVLPVTYAGNCPAPIEFIWHMTVTVPGTIVEFQWERSDGTIGKVQRAQIGKAPVPGEPPDSARPPKITAPVQSDRWRLALPGKSGQYSEVLHVLKPFDLRSAPAVVTVTCKN